jgi:hypothetical protein
MFIHANLYHFFMKLRLILGNKTHAKAQRRKDAKFRRNILSALLQRIGITYKSPFFSLNLELFSAIELAFLVKLSSGME